MHTSDDDLATDPLFIGLTRPATVLGVPYIAFVVALVTTTLVFLAVGNPLCLLLGVPLHAALYLLSAHDPGVFSSLLLWLRTNGRCRTARHWGAVSFSPLDTPPWRRPGQ